MRIENLTDLKEKLYRKGFGTFLNDGLESNVRDGNTDFALPYNIEIEKDEMAYKVHFRMDYETRKGYLNNIEGALLENKAAPGEIRKHTFPSEKLTTAGEIYRMLKYGDLVAVNKTLFNKEGVQYNTWLSLDIKGEKDEYGNYPVLSYHENYYKNKPFDIKEQLSCLHVKVKELEDKYALDNYEKALKKANLIAVTISHNSRELPGMLAVNPKAGIIDVYDDRMVLIERQQQTVAPEKAEAQQHPSTEVKKKPWQNQQQGVTWKPKQNRGMPFKH
jgi:hypothetical protein